MTRFSQSLLDEMALEITTIDPYPLNNDGEFDLLDQSDEIKDAILDVILRHPFSKGLHCEDDSAEAMTGFWNDIWKDLHIRDGQKIVEHLIERLQRHYEHDLRDALNVHMPRYLRELEAS